MTTAKFITYNMKENFLENYIDRETHREEEDSNFNSNEPLTSRSRRPRLNIPHYIALRNAFSNLARIDDFDLEELGYGFFSDVFKVTHKLTGQVMVLKRNKNTNTKMNILRELQLMNRLCHPHILKLMGACVHQGQMHALTEYINGGDLDQLILKKDVYLTWATRVEISLQIALGMEYLHSFGVFHRDLSAKNCLIRLSESNVDGSKIYGAVVADFGLAEKIPTCAQERNSLQIVGTPYVIAPEVLREKPYDQTADVFSFGILLCQLIARLPCDPEELPRTKDFGVNVDLYKSILFGDLNAAGPCNTPHRPPPPDAFLQLAIDCCQVEPTSRPSFTQIISRLKHIKEDAIKQDCQASTTVAAPPQLISTTINDDGELLVVDDREQEENVNDQTSTQLIVKRRKGSSAKRTSSSSRLSKSFSDISWELINHAANMANANDQQHISNVMNGAGGGQSSFTNPFAALEYLNGQLEQKLVDVPSQTFLEMTFNLGGGCGQECSNQNERPISRYSLYGDELSFSPNQFSTSPTMDNMAVQHQQRHSSDEIISSKTTSFEHKRAIHRAMVLSPSGGGLDLWWRAHRSSTAECDEDEGGGCERHSLAKVISALSRNSRHMRRRCISMPNLARLHVLFRNESLTFDKPQKGGGAASENSSGGDVFTFDHEVACKDSDFAGDEPTSGEAVANNGGKCCTKQHRLERTVSERSLSPSYHRLSSSHTSITSMKYNKSDGVCTNCCCAVKVSPTSFVQPKPEDHATATLFATEHHRSSWRSCMCGIGIPLIDYSDST